MIIVYSKYPLVLQHELLNIINSLVLVAAQAQSAARVDKDEESSLISPMAFLAWLVVLSCLWLVIMAIFVVAKLRGKRSRERTGVNPPNRTLTSFWSTEDSVSLGSWSGEHGMPGDDSTCRRGIVCTGDLTFLRTSACGIATTTKTEATTTTIKKVAATSTTAVTTETLRSLFSNYCKNTKKKVCFQCNISIRAHSPQIYFPRTISIQFITVFRQSTQSKRVCSKQNRLLHWAPV